MEYGPKKRMEVDCLRVTKFWGSSVYQFKLVKFILIFVLIVHSTFHLIQIYLFVNELTTKEFIHYGLTFFLLLYGLAAVLVLLIKPKLVEDLQNDLFLWEINSATEETEAQIKFETKIIETFTKINIIFAVCLSFVFTSSEQHVDRFFLPIMYIKERFPEYSFILVKIYKMGVCFTIFIFQAHCLQLIYYSQHVKFQVMMLADYATVFPDCIKEYDLPSVHPIDNELYQREMKRRITFLARRHAEVLVLTCRKIRDVSYLIGLFALCSILAGITLCFRLLTTKNDLVGVVQIGFRALYAAFIGAAMVIAGQTCEDIADSAADNLQQADWYNLNLENRKMYLICLIASQKKIAIQFTEQYAVNLELGVAVMRGIYAVVSVLITFKID